MWRRVACLAAASDRHAFSHEEQADLYGVGMALIKSNFVESSIHLYVKYNRSTYVVTIIKVTVQVVKKTSILLITTDGVSEYDLNGTNTVARFSKTTIVGDILSYSPYTKEDVHCAGMYMPFLLYEHGQSGMGYFADYVAAGEQCGGLRPSFSGKPQCLAIK